MVMYSVPSYIGYQSSTGTCSQGSQETVSTWAVVLGVVWDVVLIALLRLISPVLWYQHYDIMVHVSKRAASVESFKAS